jgi:hypothetical protein
MFVLWIRVRVLLMRVGGCTVQELRTALVCFATHAVRRMSEALPPGGNPSLVRAHHPPLPFQLSAPH